MQPALNGCETLSLVEHHFVDAVHADVDIAAAMMSTTTLEWLGGLWLITKPEAEAQIAMVWREFQIITGRTLRQPQQRPADQHLNECLRIHALRSLNNQEQNIFVFRKRVDDQMTKLPLGDCNRLLA